MSIDNFDPNKGKKERSQEVYAKPEVIEKTIRYVEEEAKKFEQEDPEMALWIQDHINAIKTRGLKGAFKNVIESVHGTFDAERVVPPERTYVIGGADKPAALHFAGTSISAINGTPFIRGAEEKMPLVWRVATLLDLVCHENAHAMSRISHSYAPDVTRIDVGYWTSISSNDQSFSAASLFDDGVTELVSQRVAREYLIGYPMVLEDGSILDIHAYEDFLRSYHLDRGTPKDYAAAREFVRSLCAHIAATLSASPELVEDAFVAGYFRGMEEFFQDADFLDAVLGPGFSEQIRSARSADDLSRIVHEYKMPAITQDIQDQIEKALREFSRKR